MNEQTLKIVAIVIFIVTYICLLIFSKYKSFIALGTAVLFVIMGVLPIAGFLPAVDWNLLLMLGGIMGTVGLFIDSKMTDVLGNYIIKKSSSLRVALLILCVVSGVISAFVDNVATVLIVAPIAVEIAKKTDTSPVLPVIGIAIMSNLQGAATLVGDTTSILLGAEAGMNFFDFFVYKGRLGLFWVVQISMVLVTVYMFFVFRKFKQKIDFSETVTATSKAPAVMLILTILLLIAGSFVQPILNFDYLNGFICVGVFLIGLLIMFITSKDKSLFKGAAKGIDYMTLLLIASLFVIIGGIKHVGVISDIANAFTKVSTNPFIIYTLIVFVSMILSGVIDNIPYTAAMLPVAAGISLELGIDPTLLYFGLIVGATLGGNLTPIGASANIAGMGILRKEGHKVSAATFMKVSVPFTLIAVLSGYLAVWLIWA